MKTASTKPKKQFVYVVAGRYQDRHGDEGLNGPEVFSTSAKAAKYIAAEAETYLKYYDAISDDGTIDYDTVNEIDGDYGDGETSLKAAKDILQYVKKNQSISINVDGEGTWADWDIFKEEVQ